MIGLGLGIGINLEIGVDLENGVGVELGVGIRIGSGTGVGAGMGWALGDRVGVDDAEDLGGGEADGLGVGRGGGVLGGDALEDAEGGGAAEGFRGDGAGMFDGLEPGGRVFEGAGGDDGLELVEAEVVGGADLDGGEGAVDEVEEEVRGECGVVHAANVGGRERDSRDLFGSDRILRTDAVSSVLICEMSSFWRRAASGRGPRVRRWRVRASCRFRWL